MTPEALGIFRRQNMLPVTQSSLVRWMSANAPTSGVSTELARYVRSEYGADAAYAQTMVGRAERVRSVRLPNGTAGLLRRFLVTVTETFAAMRASPGGA